MKKYLIDSSGRLNIQNKQKSVVVDGAFSVDAKNRLIYLLNEPAHPACIRRKVR